MWLSRQTTAGPPGLAATASYGVRSAVRITAHTFRIAVSTVMSAGAWHRRFWQRRWARSWIDTATSRSIPAAPWIHSCLWGRGSASRHCPIWSSTNRPMSPAHRRWKTILPARGAAFTRGGWGCTTFVRRRARRWVWWCITRSTICWQSRRRPVLTRHAAELVERHWSSDERRWGSALRAAVYRRLAERAVANVERYESERGGGSFVAAELPFEWVVDDVVIRGRIDRVDRDSDGLHVVDYKLGRESPSIAALLAEFVPPADVPDWRPGDIQLPVYALAIEAGAAPELAGERVADVTLVYPLDLYNEKGKPSVKGRRQLRIVDHVDGCPACEQPPARWTTHGLVCRRQLAQIQGACSKRSQTCGGAIGRPIRAMGHKPVPSVPSGRSALGRDDRVNRELIPTP